MGSIFDFGVEAKQAPKYFSGDDKGLIEGSFGRWSLCNSISRAVLPTAGAVAGGIIGGTTTFGPGALIGAPAGALAVEAPLEKFCDGHLSVPRLAATGIGGLAGGVGAGLAEVPAQVASRAIFSASQSTVVSAVTNTAVRAGIAGAAADTASQVTEEITGVRESFSVSQLVLSTITSAALGALVRGFIETSPRIEEVASSVAPKEFGNFERSVKWGNTAAGHEGTVVQAQLVQRITDLTGGKNAIMLEQHTGITWSDVLKYAQRVNAETGSPVITTMNRTRLAVVNNGQVTEVLPEATPRS